MAFYAAFLLVGLAQAQTGVYSANGTVYTVTQDTGGDVALASKKFDYPYLPYHADTGDGSRGTQQGYNICNSTTLGENSWCQTGFFNSLEDFCLWGSPTPDETVADVEEEMVAYCTSSRYGTRVIPQGALTGVQFVQTPDYIEIAGYVDQTVLDLQANDTGGEEDDFGADNRGNPMGSLLYSSAFGKGPSSDYQQITYWTYFVGGGLFCFKACDPASTNASSLCNHIYDRVGCTYNDPVDYNAINGTFTSCQGDNMRPVGEYVANGTTATWYQPTAESIPLGTVPYTADIISTSSCTTFTSDQLFTELATTSSASASITSSSKKHKSKSSGSSTASTDDATSAAITSCSLSGFILLASMACVLFHR